MVLTTRISDLSCEVSNSNGVNSNRKRLLVLKFIENVSNSNGVNSNSAKKPIL